MSTVLQQKKKSSFILKAECMFNNLIKSTVWTGQIYIAVGAITVEALAVSIVSAKAHMWLCSISLHIWQGCIWITWRTKHSFLCYWCYAFRGLLNHFIIMTKQQLTSVNKSGGGVFYWHQWQIFCLLSVTFLWWEWDEHNFSHAPVGVEKRPYVY